MTPLDVTVSFPLAFVAGAASFLSPCVLPVAPGYVTFVGGLTLEDLREADAGEARTGAVVNALAFAVGFGLVFMSLGIAGTAAGASLVRAFPFLTRLGGALVLLFGLHLMGALRLLPGLRSLYRRSGARGPILRASTAGATAVGMAFGAGWTPCIGPVLASILLFAGLRETMVEGFLLLATYGLGLALPFVTAAVGCSWILAGVEGLRRHAHWTRGAVGAFLLLLGLMMVSGRFTMLNAWLAGMGQLFEITPGA